MARSRAFLTIVVCSMIGACASAAAARTQFHPRIGGALGLIPPVGSQDVATGALTPLVYHGGSVMAGGVTVHTIFWAPAGFKFSGPLPDGAPGYEALMQQFFTDVAHDSGSTTNDFSVLPQFAQGTSAGGITSGSYSLSYSASADSLDDTDPYPSAADQCASPNNIPTCITDAQVQAEVDKIVQATPGTPRGLHNLWFVFLPPNVDECILPGSCGTNAFAAYHSVSDVGHGATIYALSVDPLIETTVPPGSDPEGNPDAEAAIDGAGHETVEAITDPEGVGWMDPNGFEVADKCEFGPETGTPLGFAGPSSSPYNEVINGHQYLTQEMWSNDDNGCVQSTSKADNPLPLPQVNLTQYSSTVSGNIGSNKSGVGVTVSLVRAAPDGSAVTVAAPSTTTAANGSWSVSLGSHAVGDDRDELDVDYSGAGAATPNHQVILTGDGGNPFTESGWTGWNDLDNGAFVTNNPSFGGPSVTLAPCFQTGVETLTFNGTPTSETPTDFCNTQTDTATEGTATIGAGVRLTASSNDNRAYSPGPIPNSMGGLVSLTVPLGEADAVSSFLSPLPTFAPSGVPSCTADLELQTATCSGLVDGASYTLSDARTGKHVSGNADPTGTVVGQFPAGGLRGGDAVSLSNGSRTLSTLHVAHLKVAIADEQTVLAGGSCQPGEYYGSPAPPAPTSAAAGVPTVALTGEICPLNGDATGLDTSSISQTDELSGGQTQTEVPNIEDTSPIEGETVYGTFTALAESGLPGPNNATMPTDKTSKIALSIAKASSGKAVYHAANVDKSSGVSVKGLKPGAYKATWTLTDANGDTRATTTRFIEQPAVQGKTGPAGPKPHVTCKLHSGTVSCTVKFRKSTTHGTLRLSLGRNGRLAALGHGLLKRGAASVTLRDVRRVSHGTWTLTLVLSQPHKSAVTTTAAVRVR